MLHLGQFGAFANRCHAGRVQESSNALSLVLLTVSIYSGGSRVGVCHHRKLWCPARHAEHVSHSRGASTVSSKPSLPHALLCMQHLC
jgi:hypothetical protein